MNAEQAETLEEVLDDNKQSSGGDYPDVWKPHDGDRSVIVGDVTDMRKNPFGSSDDQDDQYALVLDTPNGEMQTPTHTILNNIITRIVESSDDQIENGDVFKIYYEGKIDTDGPRKANDYSISHLKQEQFEALMAMEDNGSSGSSDTTEEAEDYLGNIIDFKDSLTTEQIDQMLNEEAEMNIEPEAVAEAIGLTQTDDGWTQ